MARKTQSTAQTIVPASIFGIFSSVCASTPGNAAPAFGRLYIAGNFRPMKARKSALEFVKCPFFSKIMDWAAGTLFVPDDRLRSTDSYGSAGADTWPDSFALLKKNAASDAPARTGSATWAKLRFAAACFCLGTLLLSVIVGITDRAAEPGSFTFGVGGWLLILVTTSSIVLGGGGLIWTVLRIGTSVERRSALARQAADTDFIHAAVPRPEIIRRFRRLTG